MNKYEEIIDQIPGYKIANSHFLLGSKIHISDFYFAKRMFQNNFYASKFAFLIAKYIIGKHKNEDFKDGLSLIGYGLYSELLLSLVEKFLKNYWQLPNNKISHNLINDREELIFVKGYDKPLSANKIILIVPIASTFSTSLKIEEVLIKDYKCNNILTPHINLLLVYNGKLSDGEVSEEKNEVEYKYGWKHISTKNRIISVKPFYENIKKSDPNKKVNTKEEKYFLALPTEWQDINNCKLCFPLADPLDEKALNITDKTSVTPSLVFDLPKGRPISNIDLKRPFILEPDMLEYGHFTRDENDYHYYFYIEKFFVKNKDLVKEWLDNEVHSKLNYKDSDNVLIIAPGHYSNTAFVNFVNETLFSNSANILHYDSKKDHIQNFQLFYQNEVMRADKIYYVDDTITSGGTFTRANYYIKQTREKDEFKNQPGFDAAIVLLDRSSFYVNKNIIRKLLYNYDDKINQQESHVNKDDNDNKLVAFTNLHLPSLKISHDECPLCKEKERYDQLVKISFLDRLQVHFMKQSQKIIKRDITSSTLQNNLGKYPDEESRYLKRVAAIHVLFEWFSKSKDPFETMTTFGQFISSINVTIKKILPTNYLNVQEEESIISDNATILKVLIQPPFTNYQPIKVMVFNWVLLLLQHQIKIIGNEIRDGNLQYESFRNLKFLLRRAGLLNSNFLIHSSLFDLLKQLYDNNNLYSLYEKAVTSENKSDNSTTEQNDLFNGRNYSSEEVKQNVLDFNIFYAAHVKELLFLNEARSIQLEEMLIEYGMKKDNSHSFSQLLRILREENSILIREIWEVICKNHNWKINDIYNDLSNKNVMSILENSSIQEHYRFNTLAKYFEKCGTPLNEDNAFLDYLALMKFFLMDKGESVNNHPIKTEYDEIDSDQVKETDEVILNDKEETINYQPTKITNEETGSYQVKKDSNNSKKKIITLTEKTNFIMHRLKIILFGQNNKDVGAFFIVKYKRREKDSLFLAYNYGSLRSTIETQHENIKYISDFINGIPDITRQSNITIIELEKKLDKWYNLYSSLEEEIVENLNPYFDSGNCNRLFLIRINKREYDNKNIIIDIPQGVIGFYYSGNNKIIDVNRTKYLLLLRSELSEFTNRHHENNEFWEWREENIKKSLNLLTGHGREMLISIARKCPEFQPIILDMLLVQRFVLDFNDEKRMKNGIEPKIIPNSFFHYYFKRKYELDHSNLKNEIIKMANDIFTLEDIENAVKDTIIFPQEGINENDDLIFTNHDVNKFSQSLIKLFCFEILVNAKKNRWHFDVIPVHGFENNIVEINISKSDDSILISISNTGPYIDDKIITDLNNPEIINIKGDGNDAAGIALIKTIIQTFRLGSVEFKCKLIDKEMGLSNFIVTLKLSEKELKKYVEEISPNDYL
jgi:hypothetical protein